MDVSNPKYFDTASIKELYIILKQAKSIADSVSSYNKTRNEIALFIRDELSNQNYPRRKIVEAWKCGEISDIARVRYQRLITERDNKIQKQREDYYRTAPKQVIREQDDEIIVEYGRVKNVIEKTYFDFVSETSRGDWSSYREYGLASQKKCQIIILENDNREFRVVFGVNSIGVKPLDVIKFKGIVVDSYVIIPSISSISGIGRFNIAVPITVDGTFYPSIRSAYDLISPELGYSRITQLIREGVEPDKVFLKTKKLGSVQTHGCIIKMS